MKHLTWLLTLLTLLAADCAVLPNPVNAGDAVIFNGNSVKALKSNLNLFDAAYMLTGTADPSVSATNAPQGSIYLRTGASGGGFYVKQDAGSTTNWLNTLNGATGWSVNGNAGTNPANNYLGTSDVQPLVVRTSATERLRLLSTGEFGVGTPTPAGALHVKAINTNLDGGLVVEASGAAANRKWDHYISDTTGLYSIYNPNSTADFSFSPSGGFSIGPSAPKYSFDVVNANASTTPLTTFTNPFVGPVMSIRNPSGAVNSFSALGFEGASPGANSVDSFIYGFHTDSTNGAETGGMGFVVSNAGTRAEAFRIKADSTIQASSLATAGPVLTDASGNLSSAAKLTIAQGGTNSSTALNNNRVMKSSGGAVIEAAAITANRALVSDANGIPVASSVTDTTLAFLDATSSVQTQLNGKQATLTPGSISTTTTGVTVGSGANSTVGPNVTVDVQTATNAQPGLLSAADHTSFAAKQAAGNYITDLTGDLVASGPGSVTGTLATVNGNVGSFTNGSFTVNAKGLITAASSGAPSVNAQAGTTYTFVLSDASHSATTTSVTFGNAAATTVTVPTNASVAFPIGTVIDCVQQGAGKVTFVGAGGVTINSQGGNLAIAAQYVGVSLLKTATNTWTLIGSLIP